MGGCLFDEFDPFPLRMRLTCPDWTADVVKEAQEPAADVLGPEALPKLMARLDALQAECSAHLERQGFPKSHIKVNGHHSGCIFRSLSSAGLCRFLCCSAFPRFPPPLPRLTGGTTRKPNPLAMSAAIAGGEVPQHPL